MSAGWTPPGGVKVHVAGQLRAQADSCARMGSPLYAELLERAADDVEAAGPAWDLLRSHLLPGRGDALALRLMAAVHRLVLTGREPALARHYPSAGGEAGTFGAWSAFLDVLVRKQAELQATIVLPCQTNEVGRCAGLMWGFLEVAAETGLPLRVLEVGASAGLNLRFDRFRYGGSGAAWGDPASRVDLMGLWRDASPHLGARLVVVERRGCDPRPIDPTLPESRLALQASLWADQTDRFGRLRGALDEAAAVPVAVDEASVDDGCLRCWRRIAPEWPPSSTTPSWTSTLRRRCASVSTPLSRRRAPARPRWRRWPGCAWSRRRATGRWP